MADLTQALFRIDPTEGLLQYVQAVKPYHSKVLDVFVEYIYTEPLAVTMQERLQLAIGLEEPVYPITYSCGYGFVWNPYSEAEPADLPQASIVSAQGELAIVATPTPSSSVLALASDLSNYVFPVGAPVTFTTTGTFPTASTPIAQGVTYYVLSATLSTLTVSDVPAGAPITFTSTGTGTLRVTQTNLPYNSFLVSMASPTQFDCVVSNLVTNQLTIATPYIVVGVTPALKRWVVTGNMDSELGAGITLPAPGDIFYVSGNTDPSANIKYTIATVLQNTPVAGQTTVTTVEPVSLVATPTGRVYVPNTVDSVPYLAAGTAIELTSTGTYPVPVTPSTTYYFNPTPTPGVFNLGKTRYPQNYSDIVNVTAVGNGVMKVFRTEPFVPGEMVTVTGTFNGENDGNYLINTITPEGANFRLHVLQHVPQMTPVGSLSDGFMIYTGSFGDPYCAVASSPDLFTSAFFSERIEFEFGPMPVQPYLLDTFSGIGTLNGHTTDSGHTWGVLQDLTDTLDELILDGDGNLTTADVAIWASSDWAIPGPTFFVEVELYVDPIETPNSPPSVTTYFRVFAKEAGITFFGPYVDIRPDDSGTIWVDVFDGVTATPTPSASIDTGVNTGNKVKVKLDVINDNQIEVRVNGTLVYTSGVVVWPALSFVGVNFTNPSGDVSRFRLDRILANGAIVVAPPVGTPTTIFLDTFTGVAAPLNGHVPDLGGTAWVSPVFNLACNLTGTGSVVNGTAGSGGDGRSTITGGKTTVLAEIGFFVEIEVPYLEPIVAGANAPNQSCAVVYDFGLGGEDTLTYVAFITNNLSSGVSTPNTQQIQFIVPGVGIQYHTLSTGSSLPGAHKARLDLYFDGSWDLLWNDALVLSGTGYVSGLAGAVSNDLTVMPNINPPAGGDLPIDRVAFGTLA